MSGQRKSASQTAVKPDGRQIAAGKTADRKRKGIKDWTQLHRHTQGVRVRDTERELEVQERRRQILNSRNFNRPTTAAVVREERP